jgi:hypothetical protein
MSCTLSAFSVADARFAEPSPRPHTQTRCSFGFRTLGLLPYSHQMQLASNGGHSEGRA